MEFLPVVVDGSECNVDSMTMAKEAIQMEIEKFKRDLNLYGVAYSKDYPLISKLDHDDQMKLIDEIQNDINKPLFFTELEETND